MDTDSITAIAQMIGALGVNGVLVLALVYQTRKLDAKDAQLLAEMTSRYKRAENELDADSAASNKLPN